MEDVLDPELDVSANLDVADVINYIKATQFALEQLNRLPICNRLLRGTHPFLDGNGRIERLGNYEQWVRFFLEAVSAAATDAVKSIEQLSALHDQSLALLPKAKRSKDNVRAVFDYLEQHPIIDIKRTATALDVSYNTVSSAVKKLVELAISYTARDNKCGQKSCVCVRKIFGNIEEQHVSRACQDQA